ncbi:MAG: hypothetical protein NTY66_00320 [Candidatus Vogelbacteria bacterium]|nr:hypothetical protein [Candidatus Vogelbacteria bacterium]
MELIEGRLESWNRPGRFGILTDLATGERFTVLPEDFRRPRAVDNREGYSLFHPDRSTFQAPKPETIILFVPAAPLAKGVRRRRAFPWFSQDDGEAIIAAEANHWDQLERERDERAARRKAEPSLEDAVA